MHLEEIRGLAIAGLGRSVIHHRRHVSQATRPVREAG